ncbi:hypothetical protein BV25DRAFT_1920506 [Artomyces pyxidatus]|uniref:Uncharacterized protein n=1 Tax=Artomyces pyxidatus TaxID=48021 RepID=A0ACB8SMG2_9AGAM|nr:hypothetical protein BV25DRAFT_1920506 [Artomyces pyxidatus]
MQALLSYSGGGAVERRRTRLSAGSVMRDAFRHAPVTFPTLTVTRPPSSSIIVNVVVTTVNNRRPPYPQGYHSFATYRQNEDLHTPSFSTSPCLPAHNSITTIVIDTARLSHPPFDIVIQFARSAPRYTPSAVIWIPDCYPCLSSLILSLVTIQPPPSSIWCPPKMPICLGVGFS